MVSDRPPRPSAAPWLAWAGVIVLVLWCLGPVLTRWDEAVVSPFAVIDPLLQLGILEWTAGNWHHFSAWLDLPIFYPVAGALGCMDSLLGQAVLVLPLRALLDPPAAALYNWAFLGSLSLAALGMAALWVATGGQRLSAGCAVLALLGAPYTQSQFGHLNQLPPPFALFTLAAVARAMPRPGGPRPGARWWWLTGAALVGQAAWGWYGFAYALVGVAVIAALRTVSLLRAHGEDRRSLRRSVPAAVLPALLAAGALLVLAQPQLQLARRYPDFQRTTLDVRTGSADIQHLLHEGAYRRTLDDWLGRGPRAEDRGEGVTRIVLSPGWLALVLAVYGWLGRHRLVPVRRQDGAMLLVLGGVGLVLAFGDSVGLPGTDRRLPLPLEWVRTVLPPFRAYREAWRFSWLLVIAVAWWSAVGCERLLVGRARRLAPAAAVLLTLVSLPAGVPAVGVPLRGRPAPAPALPMGPVLTLPAPADEYAEDRVEALWIARAVQFGRPVTGGAAGWVPPEIVAFRRGLLACEEGVTDARDFLRQMQEEGMLRAEIALRPHDERRIAFWRNALLAHGAVRQDPWPHPGYEMYIMPGSPPTAGP